MRKRRSNKGRSNKGGSNKEVEPEMFKGKPRYLVLSDGQVLDRKSQPKADRYIEGMIACNRANETDFGKDRAAKLLMISKALDKQITGLNGPVNILDLVWMGEMSMREVKRQLA